MTHILIRGGTEAGWIADNPVLMDREFGVETDTLRTKFGDGVTPWNLLDYASISFAEIAGIVGGKAPLASPAFTGNPTAPTPGLGVDDESIATTEFVKGQGYLTSTSGLATLASPTFTGDPKAPTPTTGDNDTSIATTAFVKAQSYAPLASPVFTGNPTSPTPTAGDNDTSVATTAFVTGAITTATNVVGKRISGEFTANSGLLAANAGSASDVVVTHSLGVAPSIVMGHLEDGAWSYQFGWFVTSRTTTQVAFKFWNNGPSGPGSAILRFRLLY